MGFSGVFGWLSARGGWTFPCEAWEARGEGIELGRDEECAWTAGGLSSLVREAQQP